MGIHPVSKATNEDLYFLKLFGLQIPLWGSRGKEWQRGSCFLLAGISTVFLQLCFLPLVIQVSSVLSPNIHSNSRNHRSTSLKDNARLQCPSMPWFFFCSVRSWIQLLHARAQYLLFCKCGGDLYPNQKLFHVCPYHSFKPQLWKHQPKLTCRLPGKLLTGERAWALCNLKDFHFRFLRRTFHTISILSFNLLENF